MKLQEFREEVWRCNLELPKNDLVKMTSGNVSGRDPETDLVVIKPSGIAYEQITPENLVIVDLNGVVVEGELMPSIDTATHLYIYRQRTDVFGVAHTHSPYATSFAVLGQPIPACLTTCGMVGAEVPLGKYVPPTGADDIGREILNVIGENLAVIMLNHGVFSIGRSPSQATRVAVEVEDIAKITHLALLRGTPIELTPEQFAEVSRVYDKDYGQVERKIIVSS